MNPTGITRCCCALNCLDTTVEGPSFPRYYAIQLFNGSVLMTPDSLYVIINTCSDETECHYASITLRWRHNERDGVSNHHRLDCLLNHLFSANQRKPQSSTVHVTGLCEGNPPVDSPHKGPVTRKMFAFYGVIMHTRILHRVYCWRYRHERRSWLITIYKFKKFCWSNSTLNRT